MPSEPKDTITDALDHALHAAQAKLSGGLSPESMAGTVLDWAVHLAGSPGRRFELLESAMHKTFSLQAWTYESLLAGRSAAPCIAPEPGDRRFAEPAWNTWPYSLMSQQFLLAQQWWSEATRDIDGVTPQHQQAMAFTARQLLDSASPSNYALTNPAVIEKTMRSGGANIVAGLGNWLEDLKALAPGAPKHADGPFDPGEEVAITPGKVVFRNHLMELIQYTPTTETVRPEPILIVPAWIMKYYILDLRPENSLVRYMVAQGYTVFIMSWRNPGAEDRDLTLDDYRTEGVMAALDAVGRILPDRKVHATGYCLGGTILSIAAAAMARDGDDRLASLSMFAAQVDFTEAGELMLFINPSQLHFLKDMMWRQGYLEGAQMGGAFQILKSNDLVWSRIVREYMMGERPTPNDLMAWNADQTRMPYRMHSQYLQQLFMDNDLASGRYLAGGEPVALTDIHTPIFSVGTVRDHVAPWRSVFKIHLLARADITFVLTSGGHNAGIVSEPGHPRRSFRIREHRLGDRYIDPDRWEQDTPIVEGSWWISWRDWLDQRSGAPVPARAIQGAIADAPGDYVHQY